jgi:hypothetical protein
MTLVYRDKIGIVSVELCIEDSVAFFEGYLFATSANHERLKIKLEHVIEINAFNLALS